MIAFGVSVTEGEAYRRYAEPGIKRAKEPDSEVYVFAAVGQASRTYNLLLDTAARHDDLEALVLVHPHTEITDSDFCVKVRERWPTRMLRCWGRSARRASGRSPGGRESISAGA